MVPSITLNTPQTTRYITKLPDGLPGQKVASLFISQGFYRLQYENVSAGDACHVWLFVRA